MKRFATVLLCAALLSTVLLSGGTAKAAPYVNSKDLHKAHENNASGVPIYNNQTVSVQGVVTVPTGVWHDSANYFSIVTEDGSYRFAGGMAVYLRGSQSPALSIGDKVTVTGVLSNTGYSADKGTTVICPQNSGGIVKTGSGYAVPAAFPICTDAGYDQLELDKGYRFEGMPVRIMGVVHQYDNEGTLRGFSVDGSSDGNYTDGAGAMQIKLYDYSGIDISGLADGDWVVVEGVLFQSDSTAPYHSGYYIRPTKQGDIQTLTQETELMLSEAMRKDTDGAPVLTGKQVTVQGIATVDSGVWNSNSNAFTLVSPVPVPGLDPVYPDGAVYVYQAGGQTPTIAAGDMVRVNGTIGTNGYDGGAAAIIPNSVTVLSAGHKVLTEKTIRSDYGYAELQNLEAMPVKLQGRVYQLDNSGAARGFSLDASQDHNWTDKAGMIEVKFYDYSGIDISGLQEGDLITLRGILQKSTAAPYTTGYFIRPRGQEDLVRRADHTRRTLYIQFDGFRNDYIGRPGWDTANLESIIHGGTRCTESYGEYVSMTTANMTTLVTGSHTGTHNVPALAFYDAASDRRVRNLQNYDVDTIGEVFQRAGLITAAVKQRKLQNRGADFMLDGGAIAQTRDDVISLIQNEDPDLLVALFNETDSSAHTYGTDSPQIQKTVEEIDDAVGAILAALEAKGILKDTNIILSGDHGMDNVSVNLTSSLVAALESTGIPFENAAVDMGPFGSDTKVVYNLSSAAAQIYFRQPIAQEEQARLVTALSGIQGVHTVYNRAQLDAMNTPANLGDLVVDCSAGYAFSTSLAEHGSKAQQHTFMVFQGPGVKQGYTYEQACENVDIVPTIYHLNGLTTPETVDGIVLQEILSSPAS